MTLTRAVQTRPAQIFPTPSVTTDHTLTHPLILELQDLIRSRRKIDLNTQVAMLNLLGPITARLFDEARALSGDARRQAHDQFLDRARLGEALQALESAESIQKEHERQVARLAANGEAPLPGTLYSDSGALPGHSGVAAMYVMVRPTETGMRVQGDRHGQRWGGTHRTEAATLRGAVDAFRDGLIHAGHLPCLPAEAPSFLRGTVARFLVFGEKPDILYRTLDEPSRRVLDQEAARLGLDTQAAQNAPIPREGAAILVRQVAAAWQEQRAGLI